MVQEPGESTCPPEVLGQMNEERLEVNTLTQKRFKWGGCRLHERNRLQVHLCKSRPKAGKMQLRCSRSNLASQARKDAGSRGLFLGTLLSKLPDHLKQDYESLQVSLERGSRQNG